MFDDLRGRLRRMGRSVSIPIALALDDERYLDRACPNPECSVAFKVLFEDWRDRVPEEAVCPICGFRAESTEWNTPGQRQQIKAVALRHVQRELGNGLSRGARSLNRSQRASGLVSVTMSYRPGRLPVLVTAKASDVMTQRSSCEVCGCRYSSVGAAFFCPGCGHNSAASTFDVSVQTVRETLAALPAIRRALTETADSDSAENAARHICENGLVKLVSAFQRFAEALYESVPNDEKPSPRRNAFQNLQESSELWRAAIGQGYDLMVTATELSDLERYFQQRHALSHNDGIVDELYLGRSGDSSYALGQRLVIRSDAVEELAALVSKLAGELRTRM